MKIMFALLLAALLPLAAYGQQAETQAPAPEAASAPAAEAAPEVTEPETEPAAVLAPSYGVLYCRLDRGEEVVILGEEDQYYRIDLGGSEGYVAKRLVRWKEPVPERRIAYAGANAGCNSSVYFDGFQEPLHLNQQLTVLDEFADWMLIEIGSRQGYIKADQVNAAPIYADYGSSGGGEIRVDGGDISLTADASQGHRLQLLADSNIGTVLADGTEVYLRLLSVDDTVLVMDTGEKLRAVWESPNIGTVDKRILRVEGDPAYETWTGYARWNARIYPDHWCLSSGTQLSTNSELEVMLELGEIYMVKFREELGFMHKDDVMKSRIAEEGGGGSYSGQEWTDPVL